MSNFPNTFRQKPVGRRDKTPFVWTKEVLTSFADMFAAIQNEIPNYRESLPKKPKHRERFLNYTWHGLYDLPYQNQLAMGLRYIDVDEKILRAARYANPIAEVLKVAKNDMDAIIEEWGRNPPRGHELAMGAITISLIKNVQSMAIYGKSINALLDEGWAGNDKAYFKALKIDPCVISSNKLNKRIRMATFCNDTKFLNQLGNAIKPPRKEKFYSYLSPVRIVILVLSETGYLRQMSRKQKQELLIDHLRLYKDKYNSNHAPDTVATLNKFIYRLLD